jgi:hypothetical protein
MGRPIKDAEVSVWEHNYDLDATGNIVERLFPETKTDSEGDVCVRFEPKVSEYSVFIFAQKADLNNVFQLHGQLRLHSVTDEEGKFHFDGACEGWLEIQCGYASEDFKGFIIAKGGDTIKVVLNNNR